MSPHIPESLRERMTDIRTRREAAPSPDEIQAVVGAAVRAGISVVEIARLIGMSRTTLYRRYLRRDQ